MTKPISRHSWCSVGYRQGTPQWLVLFWNLGAFYAWILLTIFSTLIMLGMVARRVQHSTLGEFKSKNACNCFVVRFLRETPSTICTLLSGGIALDSLGKLVFYPIVFACCWTPAFVAEFIFYFNSAPPNEAWLNGVTNVLPISQGLFFALIFFVKNDIVRRHWWAFIRMKMCICCHWAWVVMPQVGSVDPLLQSGIHAVSLTYVEDALKLADNGRIQPMGHSVPRRI